MFVRVVGVVFEALFTLVKLWLEDPWKERRLKMRRRSDQQLGMLATYMAVDASRMYQNVHMGAKG
jgi:hypothetical protein